MGLQTGIFTGLIEQERSAVAEMRSSLENPQTPLSFPAEWLLDVFNGGRTDSGIRVSELTAFQVSTFLAGVDLITGALSSAPMHVYERSFNQHGRPIQKVAYGHSAYELVNCEPNDEMTAKTLIKAFGCHALAWGAGFIEIQRDGGNSPLALWPRNPYKTKPFRLHQTTRLEPQPWRPFPVVIPAGTLVYKTTDALDDQDTSDPGAAAARNERIIPAEDMLHVPGLSFDGRIGQSAVYLARNLLGLALATEKFGNKYFANYAKPGGILELPMAQNDSQREGAKRSWIEAQGGENAHRVAVVPLGTKFTPLSNNPQDSQSVETQIHIRTQIAALLHIPPYMLGDVETKGKSNTEQQNQEFYQFAVEPWMRAISLEWKRKLFPHRGVGRTPKNPYFVGFDVSGILRPDAASREKFYASGKQWGYLNTNDIRAFEGMNPVEEDWAEAYWMPVNTTLTTTPIDPKKHALPAPDTKQEDIAA
jgi:HK97 family phage portal protein